MCLFVGYQLDLLEQMEQMDQMDQMQQVSPERRAGLGGRAPLPFDSDALDGGRRNMETGRNMFSAVSRRPDTLKRYYASHGPKRLNSCIFQF